MSRLRKIKHGVTIIILAAVLVMTCGSLYAQDTCNVSVTQVWHTSADGFTINTDVPTLSEWGMIIMSVLLIGWMALMIVRRRQHSLADI